MLTIVERFLRQLASGSHGDFIWHLRLNFREVIKISSEEHINNSCVQKTRLTTRGQLNKTFDTSEK